MRLNKKLNSNEDSFWLPATDMMAGILIVVLLLLMLFLLYLNNSKDEVFTPLDATEFSEPNETRMPDEEYETFYDDRSRDATEHDEGDGEGGHEKPTEAPTEHAQDRKSDDGYDKAAVFVTVVDADSGNTIKKSGIGFELYAFKNGIGGLQTLYSYYQEKIEHKTFETGENGTFYLPEKITKGWYSLHNITAPKGYYVDEETDFEIDDFWDWSEPYMVTVNMKPIKKTIRVMAEDYDTAEAMKDVEFKIYASGDIVSTDGSLRYSSGDVVDKIKTDEKGYAESRELYIGKYYIKQESVPEFYALDNTSVAASVSGTAEGDTGLIKIDCRKTAVTVRLIDERTEMPIEGAVYSMEGRDDLVTDKNGEITVTDLKKASAYELKSVSLTEGYLKKDSTITFKVDGEGLVNDKIAPVIDDTAYTISMSVVVKDRIFGRISKGIDLQLLDKDGNILESWTTNDETYVISGLTVGDYYVQRNGDENTRVSVYVKDTSELQMVELHIWDTIDLFALLMAVSFVIIIGLIFIFALSRKKKVKRKHE